MRNIRQLLLSFWTSMCLLCSVSIIAPQQSFGQTTNHKAYAIFLYSFTRYIEWPTEQRDDFKITIVGKSKVAAELLPLMQNKTVAGKKIIVHQVNTPEEVGNTQMIYLADQKSSDLSKVLERISGKATLVVTERDGLVKRGAGISFIVYDDNSLHFEINDKAFMSYNLKVANELKNLAHK
ncbi:YfiR family protein [Rhodocytophaga rosea]|uniref:YfiR family protein n=1 Tax=Rhodocytophaga rosea TaxID=2704465 RepID=A0A6C0GT61_9BACT|nr:YfiR family protein [Rhodocytophaga rosea]QHT70994.1 YfiR family protein [Rhodocytophaga rosea]